MAPNRPKVARFDTSMHICLQEDTWESISLKHLYSKEYALALRAFNMQYHGQMAERIRVGGSPQAGDTVHIPPVKVLLDEFPQMLPK